jgi:hypothetical protein
MISIIGGQANIMDLRLNELEERNKLVWGISQISETLEGKVFFLWQILTKGS